MGWKEVGLERRPIQHAHCGSMSFLIDEFRLVSFTSEGKGGQFGEAMR